MFQLISQLIGLLPSLGGGATATVIPAGSTDQMTAQPAADPPPVPPATARVPLRVDRTSLRLAPGQYMRAETTKDLIVLHFTAGGNAKGAFQSWAADAREVAAAYIVDLDGSVYETFDPRYWAYALGIKGAAGPPNERRAIQIEIVGWGPLKRVGEYLCSWPREWTNRYCHVSEADRYVRAPFRGIEYFSTYPEAQIASVFALVEDLCERFSIAKDVPPAELRGRCDVARFSGWRGIAAHENFRQDKWDVGPAFPWGRLELRLD